MKIRQFLKSVFSGSTIIPWMLIVAILPMLLVSYFAYNIAETILHRSINVNLMASIQKKIEVIDSYISERKLDLYQISELPTLLTAIDQSDKNGQLDSIDPALMKSFDDYLNYLGVKIGIHNVYLLNLFGKVLYTLKPDPVSGQTLSPSGITEPDLYRAYQSAKILRAPYLFGDYKEGRRSASYIYLSTPVNENGVLKAILVMKLDSKKIEEVIDRLIGYGKSEETLLAALINNKPTIVMHTKFEHEDNDELIFKNQKIHALLLRAIQGESGIPIEVNQNGKKLLAVYRYVPQLNMGMLMQYDRSEIFERIQWLRFQMLIFLGISLALVIGLVFWISRALWLANEKNEQILENIFPPFVIEELKDTHKFPAKNVRNVSVVFIDLVNFTKFVSTQPPQMVVNFLDKIFTILDQLCDKHGLMKIKTIGDAYMAATGLSSYAINNAQRALDFAIDVISAIKQFNIDHRTDFAVRIGMDSGTITEGIIGKNKYSYDIWGNAVNRASRMQSTGEQNKVQITEETYNELTNKDIYIFTPRKNINVKGLGEMNTYLVDHLTNNNKIS